MASKICVVLALVCFALAAVGAHAPVAASLEPLGLAFLAASFLV